MTALAVYVKSPAAYEALKSFSLLQLPSKATLQAYIGAFLDEPGMCTTCILYDDVYNLGKQSNPITLSTGECQKSIFDAAGRFKALKEQHGKDRKKRSRS